MHFLTIDDEISLSSNLLILFAIQQITIHNALQSPAQVYSHYLSHLIGSYRNLHLLTAALFAGDGHQMTLQHDLAMQVDLVARILPITSILTDTVLAAPYWGQQG